MSDATKGIGDGKKEKRSAKEIKLERERVYREKLKMAEYCPKVSGCSWDHNKRKD